jgi:hypothetical protein
MKDQTRRAMAYIVLRLTSDQTFRGIQDQTAGKTVHFEAELATKKTKIVVFDREHQCYLKGTGGGGFYTVVHEGTGKPLSLKMKDNQFEGFDYDSGKAYRGTVTEQSVSIHDTETVKEYQYTRAPH